MRAYIKFDTRIATKIGVKESLFLQRLAFLAQKYGRAFKEFKHTTNFIHNTLKGWRKNHFEFWSVATIARIIHKLEAIGVIITTKAECPSGVRMKHYAINYQVYNELVASCASKKPPQPKPTAPAKQDGAEHTEEAEESAIFDEPTITHAIKQQMFAIWDKAFEHCSTPIIVDASSVTTEQMLQLLENIFGGDLEKFHAYAIKVQTSKFLMGEKQTETGFRATFGWLMKQDIAEKIWLNLAYDMGDRKTDAEKYTEQQKAVAAAEVRKQQENERINRELAAKEGVRRTLDELEASADKGELRQFHKYVKDWYNKKLKDDPYDLVGWFNNGSLKRSFEIYAAAKDFKELDAYDAENVKSVYRRQYLLTKYKNMSIWELEESFNAMGMQ